MARAIRQTRPAYDFELMEELNNYIVVSLVLTGKPSLLASSGRHFSLIDLLPVTSEFTGESLGKSLVQ
jgi:hypothetical protein